MVLMSNERALNIKKKMLFVQVRNIYSVDELTN